MSPATDPTRFHTSGPSSQQDPSASGVPPTGSTDSPEVSIVVPLLDERDSLGELVRQIGEVVQNSDSGIAGCELILVDDGSTDGSWEVIEALTAGNQSAGNGLLTLRGIRFQRNYGKSTALQAGFEAARGSIVITMDADLQDDPAEIPALVRMVRDEGFDLVSGWKKTRHDPLSKTLPSRLFNAVTRWLTGIQLHDFNCGLKAYRKEVTQAIQVYGERHRYVPFLAKSAGFRRIGEKVVNHRPRIHGRTKFGAARFVNGFLDLFTLLFMDRYAQRPMHFFGAIGVVLIVLGSVINLYLAWIKIFMGEALSGRPLLFMGVLLLVVGAQFFSIGFLGEMINSGTVKGEKPGVRQRF